MRIRIIPQQMSNLTRLKASAYLFLTAVTVACAGTEQPKSFGEDIHPTQEFETIDIGAEEKIGPVEIPTRASNPCPGLDSRLTQVYHSNEPLLQAQQLNMRIEGDKIQVLLILEGDENGFVEDYSIDISKQSGNKAQAYVPIELLCAIASNEGVLAVQTIAEGVID